MEKGKSTFDKLAGVDVSGKTEKKGSLTYLSWAHAWAYAKKLYPDLKRTVYEDINGHNYHNDGKSAWVKVGVSINDVEYIDYLPIMSTMGRPKSIVNISKSRFISMNTECPSKFVTSKKSA